MTGARQLPGVVSLLTDFGIRDPYAGIVKGVLLRENAKLAIVDVSHDVPPQDIAVGAFWIAHSFRFFPLGTVHLCVVDPGVGSARAPIAAEASGHYFVAPDNGLLAGVLADALSPRVHRIDPQKLGLEVPSRTFHGRDVFAVVAARLASGKLSLVQLGPVHEASMQRKPIPVRVAGAVDGTVLFADHFGNLITDIPGNLVEADRDHVRVGSRRLRVVGTYAEAGAGECVGLVSSFGTLEIAERDGNAQARLGIDRGARLRLVSAEVSE